MSSQRSSPHLPTDRSTDSPRSQDTPRSDVPRQHSPHGHSPHTEGVIRGQSPIQGFVDTPIRAPGILETLRGMSKLLLMKSTINIKLNIVTTFVFFW